MCEYIILPDITRKHIDLKDQFMISQLLIASAC